MKCYSTLKSPLTQISYLLISVFLSGFVTYLFLTSEEFFNNPTFSIILFIITFIFLNVFCYKKMSIDDNKIIMKTLTEKKTIDSDSIKSINFDTYSTGRNSLLTRSIIFKLKNSSRSKELRIFIFNLHGIETILNNFYSKQKTTTNRNFIINKRQKSLSRKTSFIVYLPKTISTITLFSILAFIAFQCIVNGNYDLTDFESFVFCVLLAIVFACVCIIHYKVYLSCIISNLSFDFNKISINGDDYKTSDIKKITILFPCILPKQAKHYKSFNCNIYIKLKHKTYMYDLFVDSSEIKIAEDIIGVLINEYNAHLKIEATKIQLKNKIH